MSEFRSLQARPLFDPWGAWDAFRTFDRFFREFDRDEGLRSFGYAPTARIEDEGERYVLRVDVPGVSEKDVHVDLHDGVLTVSAHRALAAPEKFEARRRERGDSSFARSYVLGDKVDPEKTMAELKDGILTVSIAKAPGAQKKTISVKTA
jgi:HSP20 family protein